MCKDCGCKSALQHHHHDHHHEDHDHSHHPHHDHSHQLELGERVLAVNDRYAQENRKWFQKNKIVALNIISSPGSGKTLLLEKTLELLKNDLQMAVLVGDQATHNDADRLQKFGVPVRQINTISSCHLDAHMIGHELHDFVSPKIDLLFIENVGNLVCPAAFDLGEEHKIALLSTPEGEDKPEKYPVLFHEAQIILITKSDLIPYLDWSKEKCLASIRKVNPKAQVFFVSSKTGEGMGEWFKSLLNLVQKSHEHQTL